jgi:integrase
LKGSVFPRPSVIDPTTGKRKAVRGSTWTYQFTVGSAKDGTRRTISKGGFARRKDADAALADALARYGKGDRRVLNRPSNMPLADYLTGWLASRRPALKPSTLAGYESVLSAWVTPHIGAVRLCEVTPTVLVKLYAHLREHGGKPTPAERRRAAIMGERPAGTPLGSRSVQSVHTILHMALSDAVEQGLLQVTPTTQIPKRQRPTHRNRRQADKHWDADEAARFLVTTTGDRRHPLWALLLDTGCRRGEACALRWTGGVDLDVGLVTIKANRVHAGRRVVEGTTKTDRVRTVDLDPRTVTVLRGWRKAQMAERLAAGAGYVESGYVFTNEVGEPVRPDSLNWAFAKATRAAGVPDIGVHGLRHTSATLLLAAGVQPHVVQERLGHADIAITLGLYSHALPQQHTDAARLLGNAIYGGGTGG